MSVEAEPSVTSPSEMASSVTGHEATHPVETAEPAAPGEPARGEGRLVAHVSNKTARRLAIVPSSGNANGDGEPLILPPFATRLLDLDVLEQFAYQEWQTYNLIEVREEPAVVDAPRSGSGTDYSGVFGLLFVVGIGYVGLGRGVLRAVLPDLADPFAVALMVALPVAVAILVGVVIFKSLRSATRAVFQWLFQAFNTLLVFCIGLGVPFLTAYSLGRTTPFEFSARPLDLAVVGSNLQLVVIAIASILPSLLYFLFSRQQLDSVRETFLREVMLLDPNVVTMEEATSKYDGLVAQIYGSSEVRSGGFSISLPMLVSTLLITIGWTMTLFSVSTPPTGQSLEAFLHPTVTPLTIGFLGAYFFTINLIFRRYVRADLTPKAYSHITVRLLMTVILVWVVSTLPFFQAAANGTPNAVLLVIAFVIGIVPETGLALVQDFLKKQFIRVGVKSLNEEHPLTNLEGMNLYDRARLLEEGIENIENLAHYNLIELMLRTRIPTARLVDMFDQAVLYLRLGRDPSRIDAARDKLRRYGIRTATDLEHAYAAADSVRRGLLARLIDHVEDGPGDESSDGSSIDANPLPRLAVVLDTLRDTEWMTYLRHWRYLRSDTKPVSSPESFYSDASKREEWLADDARQAADPGQQPARA